MQGVVNAAVHKAYGGKKSVSWMEVYAGDKAIDVYGKDNWLMKRLLKL